MRATSGSILMLLAVVGCYAPSFPVGLPCSDTGECPEGQTCARGGCIVANDDLPVDADNAEPDACAVAASGEPCDGPDADLCLDDAMVCGDGGAEVCGDTSGDDDAELCNGPDLDEDCDGVTDEGFGVGDPCDGDDGDACQEGFLACATDGVGVTCGDATGTIVELCNDLDEDCDGNPHNGFDLDSDEANCGDCGVACTSARGTNSCVTGGCVPTCNNGAADCNGAPNDGCELVDTNPSCPLAEVEPPSLTVNGDSVDTVTIMGTTERALRVRIRENVAAAGAIPITARVTLTSGAATDFDLVVFCTTCGAPPIIDSDDVIEVGREDTPGVDATYDVIVEVRYDPSTPSTTCAPWSLTVTGNIPTGNRCGGT